MDRVDKALGALSRRAAGLGLIVGALAGAVYTIQSAPHMIVSADFDKLLVGALLSALGAVIGWLAGAMTALASPWTITGSRRARATAGREHEART